MIVRYQLNIRFDVAALRQIYSSGQNVIIAKQVTSQPSGPPVAWLAFGPSQSNTVEWEEAYSVYASTTSPQPGATITMTATSAAQLDSSQEFRTSMNFTAAGSGPSGAIMVTNGAQPLQFGLAQEATVNGTPFPAGPTNVASLQTMQRGTFTPQSIVLVFLAAAANNGTVLSQIPGDALRVTLTSESPSANILYDDASGAFVPG